MKADRYTVWLRMSQSFLSAIIMTKYYHHSRYSDMYCLELVTKLSSELVIFSDIVFYFCNNYSSCYLLYIHVSVSSCITITVTLQAFRYCMLYMKYVWVAIASLNCGIILPIHRLIVILTGWSLITCLGIGTIIRLCAERQRNVLCVNERVCLVQCQLQYTSSILYID